MPVFVRGLINWSMHDFSNLNRSQAAAVRHGLGPAMVLAGPGSGKTHLIVNRIRYLIENCQVPPSNILVISFTRAAARSLQRRFINLMEESLPVNFGTFHSIFFQILKQYSHYNNESLLSREEKIKRIKEILFQNRRLFSESISPEAFLKAVDLYKNNSTPTFSACLPFGMEFSIFQTLLASYQKQCRKDCKLDFEDMGMLCKELFLENEGILEDCRRQFSHILIDEYQDTNSIQYEIIKLLAFPGNHLLVVGDDDQAIYGFRGSTPGIMQKFLQEYSLARTYYLTMNYRSAPDIVKAAEKMISLNKNRFLKEIKTCKTTGKPVEYLAFVRAEEEYRYAALQLKENRGKWTYHQMAVLARTNRELGQVAEILEEQGIPFQMGEKGQRRGSFGVTELLACCSYCCGLLEKEPSIWKRIGGNGKKKELLRKMIPYAALHYLRNSMGYDREIANRLKNRREEAKELLEEYHKQMEEIQETAKTYHTIKKWIGFLEAREEAEKGDAEQEGEIMHEDRVNLLTIHGSKGLEFSYVCLIDINEGVIPGKNRKDEESIEEERRILYVGMTRAKEAMDILYLIGTKDNPRLPSRFLNPLLGKKDRIIYSSSTTSSNSALSRNSSNASATNSYSSSSSMYISSGSALGSLSSSLYP